MASFIGVPFTYGSNTGMVDELGPVHMFKDDKVVYKQVDAGGKESVYTVYAPCGAAGSAMYDPVSLVRPGPGAIGGIPSGKHCWLMYAPPIIIHGDYMSVKQGFAHINMVHRASNFSPPVSTNAGLATIGALA